MTRKGEEGRWKWKKLMATGLPRKNEEPTRPKDALMLMVPVGSMTQVWS